MKTFLFPAAAKYWGWLVLLPALTLGFANMYWDFDWALLNFENTTLARWYDDGIFSGNMNFTDEVAAIGVITGLLLLSFSAEKLEDEFTSALRLKALSWAVWCHFLVLILAILLVHSVAFYHALVYNMFTVLILFRLRFSYLLWQYNREAEA
ncbi:MAG: hypothetical protein ACK417_07450 [Bacteroidia bacterium]